jgi:membrane protein YqaA with SNARE-associated domain
LPLGSEPAVFGYIKLNPEMFWPAILVATLGNTVGGAIDWWLGYWAKLAVVKYRRRRQQHEHEIEHAEHRPHPKRPRKPSLDARYFRWMKRIGPPSLLASWLPGIGDPLCTLAGWLRLRFWPSVMYMAIGKLARYLVMTVLLLWIPDGFWQGLLAPLKELF